MFNQPLFKLRLRHFNFAPKLIPTVATFLILPLLIYLGFWQIHRAEYKQTLLDQYEMRLKAAPLSLATLNAEKNTSLQEFQYFSIELKGHYDNQHTLLLDNKVFNKQVGYQVLTPFFPENASQGILVNRGWIPRNVDRRIVPIIPKIAGLQTVQGLIFFPAKKTFLLGANIANNAWPRIVQTIITPEITDWIGQPLTSWLVLLSPKSANGFVREWNPVTISPYKNYAYALQWFGLAVTLLIIFIALNLKRESSDECKDRYN